MKRHRQKNVTLEMYWNFFKAFVKMVAHSLVYGMLNAYLAGKFIDDLCSLGLPEELVNLLGSSIEEVQSKT
jgi:hypothetical protein